MNKRGVSQVITTVLLILIVIAAIVLIWAFVGPVIRDAGSEVQAECITVQLEVTDCNLNSGPQTSLVSVRRLPGVGDLKFVRIVTDSGFYDVDPPIGDLLELESFTDEDIGELTQQVQAAAVVGEDERVCPPTQNPVKCEQPVAN
jgi:flagellin-like protein